VSKEKVPVVERARRYVSKIGPAISGSGGHTHTLLVAKALVKGFLLPHSDALALLEEWNQGNAEKWTTGELEHKLRSALNGPGADGYLLQGAEASQGQRLEQRPVSKPRPKPQFDVEALRRVAGNLAEVVDLPWLANRSEVDPATVSAEDFLARLYNSSAGERVVVFSEYKSQGQAVWPVERIPTRGPEGIWFLAQPVDGKSRPNPRLGKMSRRSEESVLSWRWMVLESDEAPVRLWLGALARLVPNIAAVTTSGGRSVHALVRVAASTKREWDEAKRSIMNLVVTGADPGALSAVRLTRLPACWRGQKEQKLLYFAPSAPDLTLEDIVPRRDVLRNWRAEAVRVSAAADRDGQYPQPYTARTAQACRFYGKFDAWLHDAAGELERQMKGDEQTDGYNK
jgi:hypothetical protein